MPVQATKTLGSGNTLTVEVVVKQNNPRFILKYGLPPTQADREEAHAIVEYALRQYAIPSPEQIIEDAQKRGFKV
jgi:hypothetical protein